MKHNDLVRGEYFHVVKPGSEDLLMVRMNNDLDTYVYVTKAKLVDNKNLILKIDAFNSKMVAEFQNCVEFALKVLEDWEEMGIHE